ncbi:hypothetical protein A2949_02180 [Candidatus Adlerbacteria bacterium RIFCSPLOWO2_01_FULL_54_21b]|nr:MAG: hypothetical protein A2949_02180 [Candidatus Adlerbacteria bacterium RIFCSPLOWO2_01_FULL_54_21b]
MVLGFLYAVLVGFRTFMLFDEEKTAEAVAAIHAQRITLADVEGANLPPVPDESENNATVAGVDTNNNGVRDDVELAIFKKYPNSAKIRAAELQYAMALQLMLTSVYNTETWIAAAVETSRGAACIGETVFNKDLSVYRGRIEEVEEMVTNTSERQHAEDRAYNFTTSYGLPNTELCNIGLDTLPN